MCFCVCESGRKDTKQQVGRTLDRSNKNSERHRRILDPNRLVYPLPFVPAHDVEAHGVGPFRVFGHQLPGDILEAHIGLKRFATDRERNGFKDQSTPALPEMPKPTNGGKSRDQRAASTGLVLHKPAAACKREWKTHAQTSRMLFPTKMLRPTLKALSTGGLGITQSTVFRIHQLPWPVFQSFSLSQSANSSVKFLQFGALSTVPPGSA